jgi:hypothetical protein
VTVESDERTIWLASGPGTLEAGPRYSLGIEGTGRITVIIVPLGFVEERRLDTHLCEVPFWPLELEKHDVAGKQGCNINDKEFLDKIPIDKNCSSGRYLRQRSVG